MSTTSNGSTRRQFIKRGAGMAAAGAAGTFLGVSGLEAAPAGGQVLICKRPGVESESRELDLKLLREMVEQSMMKLTGASSGRDAWAGMFKPTDVVGLKVNMLGKRNLKTRPELANIVADGLIDAGLKAENIIIWDRRTNEMKSCGYEINEPEGSKGVKIFGSDRRYDAEESSMGKFKGKFSRILSEMCTATINMPMLKDHGISGVTVSMKNYYGAINNPGSHHATNCNPYIADLNSHPLIRSKERLILVDALTSCYNGGPGYKPQFTWQESAIMVGTDPVAMDRISEGIIEAKRKENGLPTLAEAGRPAKFIDTAVKLGLGEGDPAKIKVVEV